jgi:capsular polysaccharide transport system permease protein
VWSLVRAPFEHGVALIAIVLTGYMPLTLWRHMTGPVSLFLRRNFSLMYHRNVTPLDLLISRLALEFAGASAAFLIVYGVLLVSGFIEPFADMGLALAGWGLMGAFAAGTALMIAAGSEYSETIEKFIPPLQYLIVPLSGCFFMVEWLPERAQQLIFYMPLVHAYESFRAGYFGPAVVTHYSFAYAVPWAIGLLALGCLMVTLVRDRVHA